MHTWFSAPASKSTLTTAVSTWHACTRAARISLQLLKLMWFPWLCAETSLQHGPIVGAVDGRAYTWWPQCIYGYLITRFYSYLYVYMRRNVCVCVHSEKFQYVTGFSNNDCQKPSTQGQTDHASRRQQKNLFGAENGGRYNLQKSWCCKMAKVAI